MPDNQTEPQRPTIKVDPARVPPELHPLIPYAEKWGITDKGLQRKLLHETPIEEIEELYRILYAAWHDIKRFTRSQPSPDEPGGYEAGIFDALSWASGDASVIVNKELSEKWLEIIGWPEQYPGTKLDPARLPSKFHPLIPYAQKWVIHDDGVRDTVIRVATNEELEALVSAVDQIGHSVIRDMANKLRDDGIREESHALFTLLELTEMAESRLRNRPDSTPS